MQAVNADADVMIGIEDFDINVQGIYDGLI